MDDLLNEFIAETREMLEALSGGLVAWEAAPDDRARLDEIFRFVHTVKGNSGFFDLPRIKALSHAAEDALAAVRDGKRRPDHALVSAVLAIIDRISELAEQLETGESAGSEDDTSLIEALAEQAPGPETRAAAGTSVPVARGASRTIRLPVELLDRMMSGVSDLVLARNELARQLRETGAGGDVSACFERVSGSIADLRDAVTRTRMQRVDNLFAPLPRMVRDLAAETHKQVSLVVDGGDVELDREMIEMLRDPLTHIIRNAIDHGIEPPDDRQASGKKPAGTLAVCARQAGNQILIEIRDDGRGIDCEKLVAKAVSSGVMRADRAARLRTEEQAALIFEPGLSTAATVTSLSGRGVGMDVVRANIERVGGLIDVASALGEGTTLTLRVPLTLTIIPALTVGAAGQAFAIPRSAIEEIVRARSQAVRMETVGGAAIATIRGRRTPVLFLRQLIGGDAPDEGADQTLIVLKLAGGRIYALAVDEVHDHEELVVKPASPAIMTAGLYAGTTLADNGRPLLLLDPSALAARAILSLDEEEKEESSGAGEARGATARGLETLLFRTLDGGRRMVALGAVERIDEAEARQIACTAGRLRVTLDDRILPLEGCETIPDTPKVKLLRLTDGRSEIAYALDEVLDIVTLSAPMRPAKQAGPVAGVALVNSEQVELLDVHWLFAHRHDIAAGDAAGAPVCLLVGADPFLDTILRPVIESAGYRVLREGDAGAEAAATVIGLAEDSATAPLLPASARIVRLRARPEPLGADDDSIHRYDRDAILKALAGPARGRRRK
ncbi:MAG TPA: chemotaxis protein CheA [Allosphingosinicella sp.]|jgi:two-component system chemotaxis sensor kinase CheA|nr:chemotaxis protein CheA [Allosphingosinicella sp.]